MRRPSPRDNTLSFAVKMADEITVLEQRVSLLEAALRVLLSDPGQPHHAADQALKVLNLGA